MASEIYFDDYGFLDNVEDLNQTNWSDYFYPSIPDGVIAGIGSEMLVTADSSGMNVAVAAGECRVRSHRGYMASAKTLTIGTASSANPRIDLIVARVSYLNSVVSIAVKTGTPSSSPDAPAVTQSAGDIWEIPLAQVAVAKNATTITAADVTDLRSIIRAGGLVREFSTTSLTPVNDCEYRRASAILSLAVTLPAADPEGIWMTSICFTSNASFTGVTFTRNGASYSPKAVGDQLNLKSRRYNLSIWWDGSYFWTAAKAL